jgi:hypothetical protein
MVMEGHRHGHGQSSMARHPAIFAKSFIAKFRHKFLPGIFATCAFRNFLRFASLIIATTLPAIVALEISRGVARKPQNPKSEAEAKI